MAACRTRQPRARLRCAPGAHRLGRQQRKQNLASDVAIHDASEATIGTAGRFTRQRTRRAPGPPGLRGPACRTRAYARLAAHSAHRLEKKRWRIGLRGQPLPPSWSGRCSRRSSSTWGCRRSRRPGPGRASRGRISLVEQHLPSDARRHRPATGHQGWPRTQSRGGAARRVGTTLAASGRTLRLGPAARSVNGPGTGAVSERSRNYRSSATRRSRCTDEPDHRSRCLRAVF